MSNPEFLAEGTAVKDLLHPDRILIGARSSPSGQAAAAALKELYASWVEPNRIVTVNLWSSELAKLVANAMLAQRISSINAVSAICERTGANIDEVAMPIGLDQRLGSQFLKAGIGFGGSCFKKDLLSLVYLASSLELPDVAKYWMGVLRINEMQRVRFVRRIISKLHGNLQGKRIAILGYAFKKDTNDTRESPAIDVVRQLLAEAPEEISIFDPQCSPQLIGSVIKRLLPTQSILKADGGPVAAYGDVYSACTDTSAIVILTDWDEFKYPPVPRPDFVFGTPEADSRQWPKSSQMLLLEGRQKLIIGAPHPKVDGSFDPVECFEDEPACSEDCPKCLSDRQESVIARENVDWSRVRCQMRQPSWVFDGRGILDVRGMEKLGFRVETIGHAGTRSSLNGE